MSSGDYHVDFRALIDWQDRAEGPGGCSTSTVGDVLRSVLNTCRNRPTSLISGAPNRVPGTVIYWTANVNHTQRTIRITNVEPDPRPGL